MNRSILLTVALAMLTGCGAQYSRRLRAAEPLSNHRFTRVEFEQAGRRKSILFNTYEWGLVSGFTLVADDGWRLVVRGPSSTGYNVRRDEKRKGEPVRFIPGPADRLTLIDPQGGRHPVKVAIGEPSPRPPHVTHLKPPTASQPDRR